MIFALDEERVPSLVALRNCCFFLPCLVPRACDCVSPTRSELRCVDGSQKNRCKVPFKQILSQGCPSHMPHFRISVNPRVLFVFFKTTYLFPERSQVVLQKENFLSFFFFKYLFIFREGRESKREGEKHQCVVASHVAPTGDLAYNPGSCPDWESIR